MIAFTSDQWVIVALVFVLGLLIGAFLTAGGRRKWKARYRDESERREAIEREHRDLNDKYVSREKELQDQETARAAEIRENRRDPVTRDTDGDGVSDAADRRPADETKA